MGCATPVEISFVIPLGTPVPPSPETSAALVKEFAERDITLIADRRVSALDPERSVAILDDGTELVFDLFLGVPKHRAPDVVIASGMTEDGYVPVESATLETRFRGVYAVGDVATAGVPKAGVFAEGAARIVAQTLIARLQGGEPPGRSPRARDVLHRVRSRSGRQRGHRLPVGPLANRKLQRAVRRPGRREGALRLQPPRPLVRYLTSAPPRPMHLDRGGCVHRAPGARFERCEQSGGITVAALEGEAHIVALHHPNRKLAACVYRVRRHSLSGAPSVAGPHRSAMLWVWCAIAKDTRPLVCACPPEPSDTGEASSSPNTTPRSSFVP